MIGVIYARYSSDSQREESIDGQLRECYAFAEREGISIFDTYIDRALSAKTDNRPQFQKMIKDSSKQKFNVIIVWKLDRFARNRFDSAHYKNVLKKNKVRVISATENISEGSEGILLESVLEGMAEYYSAELAEKVGRGMTENALKCKFNGGTVPIGYTINKDKFFEVDPVKAPYVVQAFEAYANGKTIKEIVDMLNAKGLTTSLGSKITINIVTDMLKNRRYIGEYKFRDIVQKDGIPRIVPQALFDKVQIEREKNKRATARHKAEDDYLLTTKLFCGKCGRYMTGESGTGRSGAVHRYYKCNGAKYKHTCDKKTVKKDWIENIVIKYTREMMMSDNVLEDIAGIVFRNFQKENPVIQLLKQRLSETETALNNLLKAIEEGIITSTTKQRMLELEQTRDEINLKLIKEEMKKPTITKEGLMLWLKQIQTMSLETKEHKQRLIDCFVNAVYLYDDKLVITFNYKEASKTVTLKEVNGSIIECSGAPEIPFTKVGGIFTYYPCRIYVIMIKGRIVMIVLITGASHTGKTALAQKLLEKYKYPYLSIDHLKMGLIRSGNTELTPMDDNKLTEYLWPIVREMVKTAIENRQNLIVEGCYIPFDWQKDFEQHYLEHIKYYCLVMSENYIRNHFADIKRYANVIENRLDDEWCKIESVLADNAETLELAQKYNVNYILIEDKYEINIDL